MNNSIKIEVGPEEKLIEFMKNNEERIRKVIRTTHFLPKEVEEGVDKYMKDNKVDKDKALVDLLMLALYHYIKENKLNGLIIPGDKVE